MLALWSRSKRSKRVRQEARKVHRLLLVGRGWGVSLFVEGGGDIGPGRGGEGEGEEKGKERGMNTETRQSQSCPNDPCRTS